MKQILEESLSLPVYGTYDVVVCGGGPAGCAAAVAAARHGARTLLVEKDGYLGGATVSQLVAVILSTNCVDFEGVWFEYIRRLRKLDGIWGPFRTPGLREVRGTVDPECVKRVWDDLLVAAGVKVLHHACVSDVLKDGAKAVGTVVDTVAGRRVVKAGCVVDATADGIVAAAAGVPWEQGDGTNLFAMALTKVLRMGNERLPEGPADPETMNALEEKLDECIANGEYTSDVVTTKRRLLLYYRKRAWRLPDRRREFLNVISRVLRTNPLDTFEVSRAEVEGRRQAWEAADFLRRFAPGLEKSYLLDTGEHIGVRSSRRIRGLCRVSDEDARDLVMYPDAVAKASWSIDIWPAGSYVAPAVDHTSDFALVRKAKLEAGECFGIRYGCLVASGVDNLLMAGRCISASHVAESSLRIQQTCMSTGQAAGTAAALAVDAGTSPRELPAAKVVETLAADRGAVEPVDFPEGRC